VRTAWVYGVAGANFVKTIARLATQRQTLEVVDDQFGSPTWSLHLARALTALAVADVEPGIWHCTGAGEATWHSFARAIFAELGLDPARIEPTTTDAFPRPAPRPAYSVLSGQKWQDAGLPEMPHWRDALHEAVRTLGSELTESPPTES
jgi:dTDP-4-dehydrorhamnose reductase